MIFHLTTIKSLHLEVLCSELCLRIIHAFMHVTNLGLIYSGILVMGVRLTFHWTAAAFTGLLSVPGWGWVKGWMNEWMNKWMNFFFNFRKSGAYVGMILTGENRRTRRKTCPIATLSTTDPTGLTWARTRAAAVRGRRLTAWPIARPRSYVSNTLEQSS
jgi:hypothetical protein